jgi:hypothetical protein
MFDYKSGAREQKERFDSMAAQITAKQAEDVLRETGVEEDIRIFHLFVSLNGFMEQLVAAFNACGRKIV